VRWQLSERGALQQRPPAGRRDAVRNYHRIVDAARDVLGESGAHASMEEIAARVVGLDAADASAAITARRLRASTGPIPWIGR
jgi:hypothetical protein